MSLIIYILYTSTRAFKFTQAIKIWLIYEMQVATMLLFNVSINEKKKNIGNFIIFGLNSFGGLIRQGWEKAEEYSR